MLAMYTTISLDMGDCIHTRPTTHIYATINISTRLMIYLQPAISTFIHSPTNPTSSHLHF